MRPALPIDRIVPFLNGRPIRVLDVTFARPLAWEKHSELYCLIEPFNPLPLLHQRGVNLGHAINSQTQEMPWMSSWEDAQMRVNLTVHDLKNQPSDDSVAARARRYWSLASGQRSLQKLAHLSKDPSNICDVRLHRYNAPVSKVAPWDARRLTEPANLITERDRANEDVGGMADDAWTLIDLDDFALVEA